MGINSSVGTFVQQVGKATVTSVAGLLEQRHAHRMDFSDIMYLKVLLNFFVKTSYVCDPKTGCELC